MKKRLTALVLALVLTLPLVVPARAAVGSFADVKPSDYFYDAVMWAKDAGVTTGTTATTFSPDNTCSRGEVVTFLWRAMGKPQPKSTSTPFTDVKPTDWFYQPVLWAVEEGITTGTAADKFSPSGTCTAAQVVTFLWRAMGKPSADVSGTVAASYPDNAYYKIPVAWADSHKLLILSGKPFEPEANSPRADIVTYLYLTLDKDIRTPAEALAEMNIFGVNIADVFISDGTREDGDPRGYATEKLSADPYGIGLTYWNLNFDWLTYCYDEHPARIDVSITLPDATDSETINDWVKGLFIAELFTATPAAAVKFSLSDCKLTLSDGSTVALECMNGDYSLVTGTEADMNGWYRVELGINRAELPVPSAKLSGATLSATIASDVKFNSPEEKADYFTEYHHVDFGFEKAADLFLDEGVNAVRLAVTWASFIDDETFQIDEIWLERVASAVDYLLRHNVYCIVDLHDDYLQNGFVGDKWVHRWMDPEYSEYVDARFAETWRQIAEYFKDYPRKLIFECANEPSVAWYDGVESDFWDKQAVRVNELNKIFVDTVRATGGKNTDRILNLAVAEYNGAHRLSSLTIPEGDDYLMAQVHCYGIIEPYEDAPDDFDSYAEIDRFFARIDEFVQNTGVPVIIGETGLSHRLPETALLNELSYFYKEAKQRGIPALWFEDHFEPDPGDPEHQGRIYHLYDKARGQWARPTMLDTIKNAVEG